MSPTLLQPYVLGADGKWAKYGAASSTTTAGGGTGTGTTTTTTTPSYIKVAEKPQRSYASAADAATDLGIPSSANLVTWNDSWGNDLETAFAATAATDIIVLPERTATYNVNMSGGFHTPPGTQSVEGWATQTPGNRGTWFAATRAGRGLVGLGPGARVGFTYDGSWTAPAQPKSWGYVDSSGTRQVFSSATCAAIHISTDDGWLANFDVDPCPDMGGVAFSFANFSKSSGKATLKQISAHGSWHGFLGAPNGEAGFVNTNTSTYLFQDLWLDANKPDGTTSGASPIMVNSCTNGGTWNRIVCKNAWKGMPTIWNSGGTHTLNDFVSLGNSDYGVNFEKSQAGATYLVNRGHIDAGTASAMHIGIGGYASDATITLTDVDISSNGHWAGQLSCQVYTDAGAYNQKTASVTYTLNGVAQPVHVASGI